MVAMTDIQMAMTRCKITPEMEAVFIDSMERGKLHANLKMPEGNFKSGNVPSLLASALEDFKNRQWYAFGNQLGAAMQDLAVVTFDQKFEVDAAGRGQLANGHSLGVTAVGAMSVGFLVMFAVVRGRRVVGAAMGRLSSGSEFDRLDRVPVLLDDDLEAFVE